MKIKVILLLLVFVSCRKVEVSQSQSTHNDYIDIVLKDSASTSATYSFKKNGREFFFVYVNNEKTFRNLTKNDILDIKIISTGLINIKLLINNTIVCDKRDSLQLTYQYIIK